ncbi:AhpD family alkylhydroperoxidase [Micromonospora pisi]|uniref:AhpD family alkylhydroperoxidase n=1 Tax=Micromonospora pisi TaxID=589240 RepID=A0A495JGB9_9ACTN|nr:carboxymuconolactone decarboxylase family protein [Micromonospora pisi]RKR87392.1 AhpD family alkylhydroperoxidase [Micromonospora pisi]
MAHVRISDALRAVALYPTEDLETALDRYYAPGYVHRAEGREMDRAAFRQMVIAVRGQIRGGTVTVLDEVVDGDQYAERHRYRITMNDGTTAQKEVVVFGRFAPDGRFAELGETGVEIGDKSPSEGPRLPDPDPATIPPEVSTFLSALPPDPQVKMLTQSTGTVKPFIQFARTLFTGLELPERTRELVILTTAEYTDCGFVTAQHVPIARAAGVSDETRRLIKERRLTDPSLSAYDSLVMRFTADIAQRPTVSDELFAEAREHLSDREIVEVIQVAGYYWTFGRVSTVLQVPVTQVYGEETLTKLDAETA